MHRAQGGGEECGRKPQLVFLCGKEICLEASVYCLTSVFSLKQTQNGERIIIPCGPTWPASAPSSREAVTAGSWLPCSCSPSSTCSCETVNVSGGRQFYISNVPLVFSYYKSHTCWLFKIRKYEQEINE